MIVPCITAFMAPGGGELVVVMLVLILLFGAKDAPRVLRTLHNIIDRMQRMAADFRYKLLYGDLGREPGNEKPFVVEEEAPPVDPVEPDEDSL